MRDRDLLDAGKQPSALGRLEEIPDFLKAEGFGSGLLAQHAGKPNARQMAVGHLFDAEQLSIEQHDVGLIDARTSRELTLLLDQQVVGQEIAQLLDIAAIPDLLNRDELLLGLLQELVGVEIGRNKPRRILLLHAA